MLRQLLYASIATSSQITTPRAVLYAFEQNKPANRFILRNSKSLGNSNEYIQISMDCSQHQRERLFTSSPSSMNTPTGAGLYQSQTNLSQQFAKNTAISSSKSRRKPT